MTDPSPVVGGHGPHDDHARMMTGIWPKKVGEDTVAMEDVYDPAHDDQPHWTVDQDGMPEFTGSMGAADSWLRDLTDEAHADFVRCVRDAAEVQTLRDQVDALEKRLTAAHRLAVDAVELPIDTPQRVRVAAMAKVCHALHVDAYQHGWPPDKAAVLDAIRDSDDAR